MYINLFICRLDFHHIRREEKNQVINVMNNRHVELCLTYNIPRHYISSTYQCHLKYEKAFLCDIIFSSSLLVLFNECDKCVWCPNVCITELHSSALGTTCEDQQAMDIFSQRCAKSSCKLAYEKAIKIHFSTIFIKRSTALANI